jgi:hypothetical protein
MCVFLIPTLFYARITPIFNPRIATHKDGRGALLFAARRGHLGTDSA